MAWRFDGRFIRSIVSCITLGCVLGRAGRVGILGEGVGILGERVAICSEGVGILGEGVGIFSERLAILGEGVAILSESLTRR